MIKKVRFQTNLDGGKWRHFSYMNNHADNWWVHSTWAKSWTRFYPDQETDIVKGMRLFKQVKKYKSTDNWGGSHTDLFIETKFNFNEQNGVFTNSSVRYGKKPVGGPLSWSSTNPNLATTGVTIKNIINVEFYTNRFWGGFFKDIRADLCDAIIDNQPYYNGNNSVIL